MGHLMEESMLREYRKYMAEEEKSKATMEKYQRDLEKFACFMGVDGEIDKAGVIEYKRMLIENYAVNSVNSMLASLNGFFKWMGWYDCVVKSVKCQREAFRASDRELSSGEYHQLVESAELLGKCRLALLLQTICATGIRVSELQYITVEALLGGRAEVNMKGKRRVVILPLTLCGKLKQYAQGEGIVSGPVFVTRGGKPLDRSNICRDMKSLCQFCQVPRTKVFPHNLRHLFACTYYKMKKDISHLADLLGHADINTTRIYTRNSGEEEAKELDLLGLVYV